MAPDTSGVAFSDQVRSVELFERALSLSLELGCPGGSFVANGYNGTISTGFGSPIGGRPAWTNASGGFVESVATLPVPRSGACCRPKASRRCVTRATPCGSRTACATTPSAWCGPRGGPA